MSAADALRRYYEKQMKPTRKRTTKNLRPEFDLKTVVMKWLKEQGFICNRVESKAVYSEEAGRYISGQTDAGFSDLVGVTPYHGVACFIELKAPGRRANLKDHQRMFLIERINVAAFAICADSIEHISDRFEQWKSLRQRGLLMESKTYLLKDLPA